MNRAIAALTLTLTLILAPIVRAEDKPQVLDLWPAKVPGEKGDSGDEKWSGTKGSRNLTNVSKPTLTIYRPAADKNTGAAVVIAPGGGYRVLAWDHEGEDVAAWLNSLGITGVILKYRVPRRPDNPQAALQDAQRAISLVRSKASEWGLDPKRIGMLGFSAGGHLTAATATAFDERSYAAVDDAERVSSRPDFAIMVYPGGVVRAGQLDPTIRVTSQTPPCFFAHAGDDRVSPENSVLLYLALKKANVQAELHVYASGGHGFGMRKNNKPTASWPQRCEEWLKGLGVLKPATAQ